MRAGIFRTFRWPGRESQEGAQSVHRGLVITRSRKGVCHRKTGTLQYHNNIMMCGVKTLIQESVMRETSQILFTRNTVHSSPERMLNRDRRLPCLTIISSLFTGRRGRLLVWSFSGRIQEERNVETVCHLVVIPVVIPNASPTWPNKCLFVILLPLRYTSSL